MNRDQLIASANALLELDAKGTLAPHGIGGAARTIIEGFLTLSAPHAQGDVAGLVERLRSVHGWLAVLDYPGVGTQMQTISAVIAALSAHSDGAVAEPVAFMKNGIPYSPIRFPGPWRADPAAYGLTPLYGLPINPVPAGVGDHEVLDHCNTLDSCLESFWCSTVEGSDNRLLAEAAQDATKRIRALILRQAPDAEQGAGEFGPDGKELARTEAGYRHVESVLASGMEGPAGLVWYGHAVREAFVAGAEWQERRAATQDRR